MRLAPLRNPVRASSFILGVHLLVGASASGQIRDFDQPIVTVATGGHHAPPRQLLFLPGGDRLLSAGFDKVVCEWDIAGGRPTLARTLRPPIWRGPAGSLYAMALANPAEGPGVLALAGFGVHVKRGNIALFHYPGRAERPTGDLIAQLPSDRLDDPNPAGHVDTVMDLQFSPDGRTLASCGNDGRLLLWDVARKAIVADVRQSKAPLNALAFLPDGSAVVTGGKDGILRIWDVTARKTRIEWAPIRPKGADPRGDAILDLAVTPDGHQIVFGRENGLLVRCSVADPTATHTHLPKLDPNVEPGPVEALAISHDGRLVVASQVARRLEPGKEGDLPDVACRIDLRRLDDGSAVGPGWRSTNLVYALAFSPDDRRLAFAGGDAQAVTVVDLKAPQRPELSLGGQGRSVWDVGFTPDSKSVGLARVRTDGADVPAEWEGFDLHARLFKAIPRQDLRRAVPTLDGWRVRTIDPLTLEVFDDKGKVHRIALDPERDRRWWSYSFIPPGPGHDRLALAVGCEAGVAFYAWDAARIERTHLYADHSGPVYAVAPSPDGRWLATGSSDQTVKLWRLAGCDRLAPFGARFQKGADGRWRVAEVVAQGFGDIMGLKVGDLVERCGIGAEGRPDDVLPRLDAVPPNTTIQLLVRRAGQAELIPRLTTKRDFPALSLFLGVDREWVLWMPQGYYETSIDGDRRYLVWHRNGPNAITPTDAFPADKFEREFRRPQVLSTLMTTADVGAALALVPAGLLDPAALVRTDGPPIVRIAPPPGAPAGPIVVNAPAVVVTPDVTTVNARLLASVRAEVDGRPVGVANLLAAPAAAFLAPLTIPVPPGAHRVSIRAVNSVGKERVEGFDVVSTVPEAKPPKLVVLTVGVAGPFGGSDLPPIRFADQDARDLGPFFADFGKSAYQGAVVLPPLADATATAGAIRQAFAKLGSGDLGPGDTLVVFVESHLLTGSAGAPSLAGADSATPVPADAIADDLTRIAAGGCRVLLLVDALHDKSPRGTLASLKEWVRDLYRKNVIAFVASNDGPSRRYAPKVHGAFVQGLLDSPTARGQARPWVDPKSGFTIDDFKTTVIGRVEELTNRKQRAACYLPETLSSQLPLFDRSPPR